MSYIQHMPSDQRLPAMHISQAPMQQQQQQSSFSVRGGAKSGAWEPYMKLSVSSAPPSPSYSISAQQSGLPSLRGAPSANLRGLAGHPGMSGATFQVPDLYPDSRNLAFRGSSYVQPDQQSQTRLAKAAPVHAGTGQDVPKHETRPEWQSLDKFFEQSQTIDSLEDLKKGILDAKFWFRHMLGELSYEQEKTEHLEAVCVDLDETRAAVENKCVTALFERDKIGSEAARLTQELNRLNSERDSLIGRAYVLEERLKCMGDQTGNVEAMVTGQEKHLQSVRDENSAMKLTIVKLEGEVKFYEQELAMTKVRNATMMEDKEHMKKLVLYYVEHLEDCDPSLIISMNDKEKIEALRYRDPKAKRRATKVVELPPEKEHHGSAFGKMKGWLSPKIGLKSSMSNLLSASASGLEIEGGSGSRSRENLTKKKSDLRQKTDKPDPEKLEKRHRRSAVVDAESETTEKSEKSERKPRKSVCEGQLELPEKSEKSEKSERSERRSRKSVCEGQLGENLEKPERRHHRKSVGDVPGDLGDVPKVSKRSKSPTLHPGKPGSPNPEKSSSIAGSSSMLELPPSQGGDESGHRDASSSATGASNSSSPEVLVIPMPDTNEPNGETPADPTVTPPVPITVAPVPTADKSVQFSVDPSEDSPVLEPLRRRDSSALERKFKLSYGWWKAKKKDGDRRMSVREKSESPVRGKQNDSCVISEKE